MALLDRRTAGLLSSAILLFGCASSPVAPRSVAATTVASPPVVTPMTAAVPDGPPSTALVVQPEPTPIPEPLIPAANQPYVIDKQTIVPDTRMRAYSAKGVASWYGTRFNGRKTSSGERYNMGAFTAAHRTLPIPCYVRITNLRNGRTVIARINDRGPYTRNRLLDVSYATADKLGFVKDGKTEVLVERVFPDAQADVGTNTPPTSAPATPASSTEATPTTTGVRYWQVAAFHDPAAAGSYRDNVVRTANIDTAQVNVVSKDNLCRVMVGPYYDTANAETIRQTLSDSLGVTPLLSGVERQ